MFEKFQTSINFFIGFIRLYLLNLYRVLHIAPLSSKSRNVPFILYNCMQCSFMSHDVTFLDEMVCALGVTDDKTVIF